MHEVWPDNPPDWIEVFGEAARSGNPKSFELFPKPTGKFYRGNVYRPGESRERLCVVFDDITSERAPG